ncbi:MAG: HAD family hydrolase [Eubacteriales bacterium]|nr:HAD family hydrolase [Eubacteriales bacterium]
MIKAIFFDIDGTLYDFSGNMPASTRLALRRAREYGHKLIICSGRARYQIYPELFSLFDGCIGSTGAYIEDGGEVLSEHFMSKNMLIKVMDVATCSGAKIAAMTKEHMILDVACRDYIVDEFDKMECSKEMLQRIMGAYELTEDLSAHTDIQKILYYDSKWSFEQMAEALSDICDVTASSFVEKAQTDGEITMKGINKSYGIRKYIDAHGISIENTIAFGDGPNDVDMLQYASVGIAMGNSIQEVKDVADYVTKDVSAGGILHAMSQFKLI